MLSLLLNPDELRLAFAERYRRPPPWFEIITGEVVEELARGVSARIGLSPGSGDMRRVLDAAWARMPGRRRADGGLYLGWTEPLASAVPRLGVPRDGGVVHLWHSGIQQEREPQRLVQIRLRDVIEFEGLLWGDGSWMIDGELCWVLVGEHDYPAYLWRFGARA